MTNIVEVHDLFPISEQSAYIAFAPLDQEFDPSKRDRFSKIATSIFEDGNPSLFRFLLYRQKVRQRGSPAGEIAEAVFESYRMGLIVGYTALQMEAEERTPGVGTLPEISIEFYGPWIRDTIDREVTDIEALSDILGARDSEIDAGSDEAIEADLEKLELLERLNKFRFGYVSAFFKSEPALNNAVDRYITETNPLASAIRLSAFGRAVRDVCSIFKAYHEVQSLKATLGNS